MKRTLEEAIKYYSELAEKQEITAKSNLIEIDKTKVDGILRIYDADEYESCMKCASEHRQLAEWLKKLLAYEEAEEEIKRKMHSGQWSDAVVYGMSKATVIIKKCRFAHNCMEVNADE